MIKLDISSIAQAEFNKAIELCIKHTERTYPEFMNGQGLRVASFAIQETDKADANKIAWQLGQTDRRFVNKRTGGQLKTPRRVYGNSRASLSLYRIINWRRKRTGKRPLGGQEMSSVARKMRAASLRSTGFIASGWIPAVKGLSRLVGYHPRTERIKTSGAVKGWVRPATFALNSKVVCELGNSALLAMSADRTGKRPGNPLPIANKGIARAMIRTSRDMMDHLVKKLMPVFSRYQATGVR